ncbi:hypothetical protein KDA23_07385 [Candidatus Saccharibacteria bacterium]|nr:hypothetical protein [Candidatus Saccharibacteria bacterium]
MYSESGSTSPFSWATWRWLLAEKRAIPTRDLWRADYFMQLPYVLDWNRMEYYYKSARHLSDNCKTVDVKDLTMDERFHRHVYVTASHVAPSPRQSAWGRQQMWPIVALNVFSKLHPTPDQMTTLLETLTHD